MSTFLLELYAYTVVIRPSIFCGVATLDQMAST